MLVFTYVRSAVPISNEKSVDTSIQRLCLLDSEEIVPLFEELSTVSAPTTVGFLNQHAYNLAQKHPCFRSSLLEMRYLLRDGIGLKLACRINRCDPKSNLNGTDLIPRLIAHLSDDAGRDCQFFSIGTQDPWLTVGSQRLYGDQPFQAVHGFLDDEEYLQFVKRHHKPGTLAVLVLALGMPRQEHLAAYLSQRLDIPCLIICGGAIIDLSAQRFPRAPKLLRQCGLEWAFRLFLEPRRLFARYVFGIPLFFFYVLRNRFHWAMAKDQAWTNDGRD